MPTKKEMAGTIAGLRVQSEKSGQWREKFLAADKGRIEAEAKSATLASDLEQAVQTRDFACDAIKLGEAEILRRDKAIEALKADAAKLVAENLSLQGEVKGLKADGQAAAKENARLQKEVSAKPKVKVIDSSAEISGLKAEIDRLERELASK